MATPMNRKDTQREIDEELFIYEQRVLELKTRRNTFTDIAILPSEILGDIFNLVQVNSRLKEWHQIAHVCRHWRDIAINTPTLWTNLPMGNQNYTGLMLERSKLASLNVFLGPHVSETAATTVLSHMGRIQALTLCQESGELANFYNRLGASGLDHRFSRLESLGIDCSSGSGSFPSHWTLSSVTMGWPTSLLSLHLKRFTLDWQMLAPLNLKSLSLTDMRTTEPISIEAILYTLMRMPCLQHLELSLARLISPPNAPNIEVNKVPLPRLKSLDVSDHNHERLQFFLSCLSLPKLHRLKVDLYMAGQSEDHSLDSRSGIATSLANGDLQGSAKLLVVYSHISISTMNEELVDIQLPPRGADHLTNQLLEQIAPIFPDLVQVAIRTPLDSDELIQIFGTMRKLRALTVRMDSTLVSALIGALTHCPGQEAAAFPSLDTIGCDNRSHYDRIDPGMTADFCNALLRRSEYTPAINAVYWMDDSGKKPLPQWAVDLLVDGGICVMDGFVPIAYGF